MHTHAWHIHTHTHTHHHSCTCVVGPDKTRAVPDCVAAPNEEFCQCVVQNGGNEALVNHDTQPQNPGPSSLFVALHHLSTTIELRYCICYFSEPRLSVCTFSLVSQCSLRLVLISLFLPSLPPSHPSFPPSLHPSFPSSLPPSLLPSLVFFKHSNTFPGSTWRWKPCPSWKLPRNFRSNTRGLVTDTNSRTVMETRTL